VHLWFPYIMTESRCGGAVGVWCKVFTECPTLFALPAFNNSRDEPKYPIASSETWVMTGQVLQGTILLPMDKAPSTILTYLSSREFKSLEERGDYFLGPCFNYVWNLQRGSSSPMPFSLSYIISFPSIPTSMVKPTLSAVPGLGR